jgi:hypothetical protein
MTARHIRSTTPQVEQILKTSVECRDSDMILWLAYCANHHQLIQVLGMDAFNKLKKFMRDFDVPTVETVGRIRRKFQEVGMYKNENPEQRKVEAKAVQKELGYNV